ncbi:MAG: tetratricopeptide repeat protein [Alphaproteobacteria bacterium]|nr:tetratricopeptide repeat protein [Alphaproteobacteria bacterium]
MEHLLILPTFVLGTLLGHFYLSNHDGIVVVEESFSTNLERVGHSSESIMNDLEARIDEIEEETVVRSQLNPNRDKDNTYVAALYRAIFEEFSDFETVEKIVGLTGLAPNTYGFSAQFYNDRVTLGLSPYNRRFLNKVEVSGPLDNVDDLVDQLAEGLMLENYPLTYVSAKLREQVMASNSSAMVSQSSKDALEEDETQQLTKRLERLLFEVPSEHVDDIYVTMALQEIILHQNIDKAKDHVVSALKRNEMNPSARALNALFMVERDGLDAALTEAQAIASDVGWQPSVYMLQAELLDRLNKTPQATKLMADAYYWYPQDFSVGYEYARLLMKQENYVEADKLLREALRLSPRGYRDHISAKLRYVASLLQGFDILDARAAYERSGYDDVTSCNPLSVCDVKERILQSVRKG